MGTKVRSAFTLIELLIVIAIIGILAASMLGLFSGTTEMAQATKCMNNMRELAKAADTYANQNEYSHYPNAGSYVWQYYDGGDIIYYEQRGWIARNRWGGGKKVSSVIPFSDEDNFKNKDASNGLREALMGGTLWSYVEGARSLYLCPVHADACYKKNKRRPGWSYVMNPCFGWASNGDEALGAWSGTSRGAFTASASRTLMFAEIQGIDDADYNLVANLNEKGEKGDSVLQYEDDEFIGFNHKENGRWVGHVAFVDGHVGKFIAPKSGSIDLRKLTEKLCTGHELEYRSGSGEYIDLQER